MSLRLCFRDEQKGFRLSWRLLGKNCRSLGFARDDKGDGSAPIEGSGASDMSPDAVFISRNLPQASQGAPDDTSGGGSATTPLKPKDQKKA
jgi:hypothetical protein